MCLLDVKIIRRGVGDFVRVLYYKAYIALVDGRKCFDSGQCIPVDNLECDQQSNVALMSLFLCDVCSSLVRSSTTHIGSCRLSPPHWSKDLVFEGEI